MLKDVIKDAESRMDKALDALRRDLEGVRTGRASTALVDRITVESYGTIMPLNQVAGISVPEARMIVIQPWDKGTIGAIEKAIQRSDLGLNPNNDGSSIRINLPPLTEERRKQLVKVVHSNVEDAKVSIRNVRRDAMSTLKELSDEGEISEDDGKRGSSQVDDVTKKHVEEADRIGKSKEQEILEF
ncbi:MAG TPA: ribosome recycling factor [Thermomicrobiales bacterium]|jgi:ribosome recycling factor|nr:ribosome recycling factor [Thermomicrobiales bacterium]